MPLIAFVTGSRLIRLQSWVAPWKHSVTMFCGPSNAIASLFSIEYQSTDSDRLGMNVGCSTKPAAIVSAFSGCTLGLPPRISLNTVETLVVGTPFTRIGNGSRTVAPAPAALKRSFMLAGRTSREKVPRKRSQSLVFQSMPYLYDQ